MKDAWFFHQDKDLHPEKYLEKYPKDDSKKYFGVVKSKVMLNNRPFITIDD